MNAEAVETRVSNSVRALAVGRCHVLALEAPRNVAPKYASDGQHGHQGSSGRCPGGNRDEVSRGAWVRKEGRNARVKLGRLRDHCLAYVNGRLIGPRVRRELPVPVTMVGVWRTKNLEVVRALVGQLPEGSQVHLGRVDQEAGAGRGQ